MLSQPPGLPFELAFLAAWPAERWRDLSIVLAVSGGADSVATAHCLARLKSAAGGKGRLAIAHFDHRLRPDSRDDAEFVRQLSQRLNLPFELGAADADSIRESASDGVEAAARQARYHFLQQTAQRLGARHIVTAHTADDQVETVLFNILRGTGLSGLSGIPRVRSLSEAVSIVRPMLTIRRTDVLAYLESIGESYREDPTNASLDFTRNRIRHELLPLLREQFAFDVDRSLVRLSTVATAANDLIGRLAGELLDQCREEEGRRVEEVGRSEELDGEVRLNLRKLAGQDRHLVREMFVQLWREQSWPAQSMGFDQWDALAELALAPSDAECQQHAITVPGAIQVRRRGDELCIADRQQIDSDLSESC